MLFESFSGNSYLHLFQTSEQKINLEVQTKSKKLFTNLKRKKKKKTLTKRSYFYPNINLKRIMQCTQKARPKAKMRS